MRSLDSIDLDKTVVCIPATVCGAAGATDAMLHQPATLAVDAAGTGYSDGEATMVLADGNTITVTLTTDEGEITALAWADGYSTSASDTAVVAVVQEGGADGTAHVATYSTAADSSPCFLDFGTLRDFADVREVAKQYSVSAKTVTEHDTAPGGSKTLTLNLYWSDEKLSLTGVATLLADRKVASAAKTLTNAVDTTQHWGMVAAFTPAARFCYVTLTWTALDAGGSFTTTVRLNRV